MGSIEADRPDAVADLFDYAESRRRADEGMAKAAERAGGDFRGAALDVLRWLARNYDTFTADDFWREMHLRYPQYPSRTHGDASGSAFQAAYRAGLIRKTGARTKSARPEAHCKELPVLTAGERVGEPRVG